MFNAVNFSDNVEMIVGALDPLARQSRDQADAMSLYRRRWMLAARFGVSPTMPRSCASPEPIRSIGQFEDSWRSISEAMMAVETTGERMWEAEVNRITGEIALLSPEPDSVNRALAAACPGRARDERGSWRRGVRTTLPAACAQRERTPEMRFRFRRKGLETCDLKEAKGLLEELA
jgi:hypothetical protein